MRKFFTAVALVALSFNVNAALIAQLDGSVPVTAVDYSVGMGNSGDANFIDEVAIAELSSFGSNVIVTFTMGEYVDYFKPSEGSDLLAMLTSNDKHLWSSSFDGIFVAPDYYTAYLGGSAANWPEDGRQFLPFWGYGSSTQNGGCCESSASGSPSWGQAFTIEATVVPVPAAIWLFGSALAGLGWMRRK